jgi:hypothetical protein
MGQMMLKTARTQIPSMFMMVLTAQRHPNMPPRRGEKIAIVAGAVALAVLGLAAWRAWPHLRFWWLFEALGMNAQGYPEYRHRKTGIVFVSLPGGKLWTGAQKLGNSLAPTAGGGHHRGTSTQRERAVASGPTIVTIPDAIAERQIAP